MFMKRNNVKWLKNNFNLNMDLINVLADDYGYTISILRKNENQLNTNELEYLYQTLDNKTIDNYKLTSYSIDKILNLKLELIENVDEENYLDIDKLFYACDTQSIFCQRLIKNYVSFFGKNNKNDNNCDDSKIKLYDTISTILENYEYMNKFISLFLNKITENNIKGISITKCLEKFIFSNIFKGIIMSDVDLSKKVDFTWSVITNQNIYSKLTDDSLASNRSETIKYLLKDTDLFYKKMKILFADNREITSCLLNNLNAMPNFLLNEIFDTYSSKETKDYMMLITKGNISRMLNVAKNTPEIHNDYLKRHLKDISFYRNYEMKVIVFDRLRIHENDLEYKYKVDFLINEKIGSKNKNGLISYIPNKDFLIPTLDFLRCEIDVLCEKMDILEMVSNQLDDGLVTLDTYKKFLGYLNYGLSEESVEDQISLLDRRSNYFKNHSIESFFKTTKIDNNYKHNLKKSTGEDIKNNNASLQASNIKRL